MANGILFTELHLLRPFRPHSFNPVILPFPVGWEQLSPVHR